MSYSLYAVSCASDVVSLSPDWDITFSDRKVEDVDRADAGRMARYVWGVYKRVEISISQISSSDRARINTWWENTIAVALSGDGRTVNGYIAGKKSPIGKMVAPYDNLFEGRIILETY